MSGTSQDIRKLIKRASRVPEASQQALLLAAIAEGIAQLLEWKEGEAL